MSDPIPKQGPFYEYSVVYTDRVTNLMSPPFQEAMRDINRELKEVYNAPGGEVALIPGSGSYAMEAVARQFANNENVLVVRNGYFSFRWSDIFGVCGLPKSETVLCAAPVAADVGSATAQIAPPALDAVLAAIAEQRPAAVFMPHVETATGILLPDAYIAAVGKAVHEVGGVLVVDGIAAGNVWLDMEATGADCYVSAPQKGWTGPCCVGIAVLSAAGAKAARARQSNSFACNLVQWLDVMAAYENADGKGPGFKYYTTLPTDALLAFRDVIAETKAYGFAAAKERMLALGAAVRAGLAARGFKSVAADGFAAPGVVVVYSAHAGMVGKFKAEGLQVAGGVPWKLGEDAYDTPIDAANNTFRIGLFGLDKIQNVDFCVDRFFKALDAIIGK